MENFFERTKRRVVFFIEEVGGMTLLFKQMCILSLKPPLRIKKILQHMVNIGVNTLPLSSLMAVVTGMALGLQSYFQLRRFDAESFVGSIVAVGMARELGPVLTAIIVTGRIGSATAAEIGTMRVTEQLDALSTMGIDPVKFLAVPRLWAAVVMLPVLTVFTDLIGSTGGYLVAVVQFGVNSAIFLDKMDDFLDLGDVINGLIKSLFFGVIIILVSCYKGFTASAGAEGVGKATTSAVVVSSLLILVTNYFLTVLLPF